MPNLLPHHAREGQRMLHPKYGQPATFADLVHGGRSAKLDLEHTYRIQRLSEPLHTTPSVGEGSVGEGSVGNSNLSACVLERRDDRVDLVDRHRADVIECFSDRIERHEVARLRQKLIDDALEDGPQACQSVQGKLA
ncbi:MAG TPA: hypothetical protein VNO21_11430 [Polyangiaceae bacterium]|nr:hypothetical protein [Polyangiaceae bacterium]